MEWLPKKYYSLSELSKNTNVAVLDLLYSIQITNTPVHIKYNGSVRVIKEGISSVVVYNSSFIKMLNYEVEDLYFHLVEKNKTDYCSFSFSTEGSKYDGDRLITVKTDSLSFPAPIESFKKCQQHINIDNVFLMESDIDLSYLNKPTVEDHKVLTTKEREYLQATIGLLTKALVDVKGVAYKSGDKVNASKVTTLLSKYLPGDTSGLSDSALRRRIAKGLSILEAAN